MRGFLILFSISLHFRARGGALLSRFVACEVGNALLPLV